MKMADAKQKRNEQLKRWIGSETDQEPPVVKRKKTKVKFDDGAVFLAACSSGDTDEVLRLLERGADINYANVDGLTALHQACIDDNVDMVKFLVENGANINQPDNEGWIPLHAAASCGYLDIAEYLISQGAHVGAVNSEGDTPLDIAEEEAMEELLQNEVNRQGNFKGLLHKKIYDFLPAIMPVVDSVDPASWRQGLRKTGIILVPSKGQICQREGHRHTPFLSKLWNYSFCGLCMYTSKCLTAQRTLGRTRLTEKQPCVLQFPTSTKVSPKEEERKDESPASWRLGLRKTGSYGALAEITASKETQKEKDSTGVMRSASSPRLSSSLDNKDKDKDTKGTRLAYVAPTIPRRLASTSDIEEKENRDTSASLIRGSGSYTRRKWEEDAKKNISNEGSSPLNTTYQRSGSFGRRQDDLISSSIPSITSVSTVTSPAGLQKSLLSSTSTATKVTTGSATAGIQSSTSNRLWAEDSTERDKDNVPTAVTVPVAPSVVNTATTTALTTTTSGTVSSTSEVRERRRSYLTPVRDEESESQRKARSRQARQSRRSTQGVTLTDLQEAEKTIGRSRGTRTREQENEEKEKEEKEKQDKEKQEEKKESESKDDDYRQRYTRTIEEPYHRYRTTPSTTSSTSSVATSSSSSQLNRPNSLIGITSAYSRSGAKENERETGKKEEEKEEDKSQTKSIRERRRPREKRRSTGVSFWTQDSDENEQEHPSDSEEGTNKKETQGESISRYDTGSSGDRYDSVLGRTGYSYLEDRKLYSSKLEKEDTTDFKKLYEQIVAENEKLKAQLHDTNMELTDLKLQLEKATQRQERFADRSLLEMEKRERRALERRISEMEEELKMLPDLKADNQRLKDENGALIRVISKLSK
uniref:protein phosphatase 1 regulatory subunit 12A n=1 Tax=Podarcis muralis TaxID=64176 RepID=UPI00109F4409|nr:protein phosphatase 1 regulatory subunit 12A [Podarcis muralis]